MNQKRGFRGSMISGTTTMRILFVSRSLPFHHIGGMEAVAWDLARALAVRGHKVEILTTACDALPEVSMQEGVRIRTIPTVTGRYSRSWWKITADLFEREYATGVDLIMGVGMGAYSIAQRRERNQTPPLIMQSHGTAWGELISKLSVFQLSSWLKASKNIIGLFNERKMRRFDEIIAIGEAVMASLTAPPVRQIINDTPIRLIRNGVDTKHFTFALEARRELRSSLRIPETAPVLITASRLHMQKGIQLAIAAFKAALSEIRNAHFIIVGDGPARKLLENQTLGLGIANHVHFTGSVDRANLPAYLSAADAFIFTTLRQEGLPLGPLEAASNGLPVVMSSHIAIPGFDFSAVDPANTASVADQLVKVLKTPQEDRRSTLPIQYTLDWAVDQYEAAFSSHLTR